MGLWVEFGKSTHQGTTPYFLQYGHTNVDALTARKQQRKLRDLVIQIGIAQFLKLLISGQWNKSWSARSGGIQSNSLSSDTDGQNMPSARYQVELQWHWFSLVGDTRSETDSFPGQAILLQPEELATRAGAGISEADPNSVPEAATEVSILSQIKTSIFTILGVAGLGNLQKELLAQKNHPSEAEVWHSLSPSFYRSLALPALAASASVPVGRGQVGPVGAADRPADDREGVAPLHPADRGKPGWTRSPH